MSWDIEAFRNKLEDQHEFPGTYMFKFIVPTETVPAVEALWEGAEVSKKASSGGKYTSVTIQGHIQSADHVILIYQEANKIEGCIAL